MRRPSVRSWASSAWLQRWIGSKQSKKLKDYQALALAGLVKQHGPIPPRPMTRSGGGGLALFFRHRGEAIHGATGWPVPGIDPRRGKLSVTVPPSIHIRTRRPYAWAVAPWEVSPPDAPGWLLKAVTPPPPPIVRSVSDGIDNADPVRRSRYAEAALRNAI